MTTNNLSDELAALRVRRTASVDTAERDLLDRLETLLWAVEDLDDALSGTTPQSVIEAQLALEQHGRAFVAAARAVGRRVGDYRPCLRREADGAVIVATEFVIDGAMAT